MLRLIGDNVLRAADAGVNLPVVGFVLAVSLTSGLIFGLKKRRTEQSFCATSGWPDIAVKRVAERAGLNHQVMGNSPECFSFQFGFASHSPLAS
jgi:hypothetical protein